MLFPSPLHNNSKIGLIAPSSPLMPEKLIKCIEIITSFGYEVVLGKSAFQSYHGYLAGSDEIRANDINDMFKNPEIDAIFCIRGGYGSTRLMKMIDYKLIHNHPKIFVGYSDITALHLAFHRLSHLVTFHGPMVSSNMISSFDTYSYHSLFHALSMPSMIEYKNPLHFPLLPLVPGRAKGRIIGGCLSLVAPSIGTFYQPDFRDTILFLEDVDESLPRCDKLMQQLKNSGILSQINGILLGNFTACTNQYDPSYTMFHYFTDFFKDYNKPVIWGIQSGHGKPMATIPLGSLCTFDTNSMSIQFHYC